MNAELRKRKKEVDEGTFRENESAVASEDHLEAGISADFDEGYLSRFLIVFLVILITIGFLVIYGLVFSP